MRRFVFALDAIARPAPKANALIPKINNMRVAFIFRNRSRGAKHVGGFVFLNENDYPV